ncbi:protein-disulfide reductase DsbD [Idiomarina sp. OT37-5b]|uniref:Thiol:disulfide interchange protein DsbD n=1 Tax=Idiomarina aquatica TaxID=1327752 RepID=A0AA94ECV0_9GAMM|nr:MULTISPECIES: protein-disulfide reductase DsbD [Idiomarina]AVJ56924.1 protein-disulfide reductase DsbD [Idiomarina sp. OT37-5b]RUO40172.1 protein-disulfide reductase DsbD [Idiomarina aquatica]
MKKWFWVFGIWLVLGVCSAAQAQSEFSQSNNPFQSEPEFLPVEEAFSPELREDKGELTVSFNVQPGYYLYKHQFKVKPADALAQPINFPPSESHVDEFFGESQIFRDYLEFQVQLSSDYQGSRVELQYQGCADAGLCYPPTTITLAGADQQRSAAAPAAAPATSSGPGLFGLEQQSLLLSLALFFALGIGLAFTPCVFPMYPILSSVVIGDKPRTFKNALWLSFIYVQGMAITYSLLGLLVAMAGMQYQAYFQHPAVLIVLSVAFGIFALSMLGLFTLQLPSSWQSKLQQISGQQRGGNVAGVFVIGMISGLVASPCTTAPLSGALLYIAQSGDVMSGAAILYALSLGMGVPLMIFGVSGGKLLPKAGAWMTAIKHAFGWLLLAVVVVLIERLLSTQQAFWLWIGYFVALAVFMGQHLQTLTHRGAQTILFVVLVSGTVGGIFWQVDKLERAEQSHALFTAVNSLGDIEQQLAKATENGQWVMLDLYADWCVACKEFEQYTFSNAEVQAELSSMRLLQADVTKNDAVDQQILTHYQVMGLPTVLFFNPQGTELTGWRVTGFQDAERFLEHLEAMKAD